MPADSMLPLLTTELYITPARSNRVPHPRLTQRLDEGLYLSHRLILTIDNALTISLDHLPAQMHRVIATRADPSLPLSRLCARGQLTEPRTADLRFISDELESASSCPSSPGGSESSVPAWKPWG
ncbi:MAG: hypothetical protein ACE5LU_09545 [Anaerolineae bacterium]